MSPGPAVAAVDEATRAAGAADADALAQAHAGRRGVAPPGRRRSVRPLTGSETRRPSMIDRPAEVARRAVGVADDEVAAVDRGQGVERRDERVTVSRPGTTPVASAAWSEPVKRRGSMLDDLEVPGAGRGAAVLAGVLARGGVDPGTLRRVASASAPAWSANVSVRTANPSGPGRGSSGGR